MPASIVVVRRHELTIGAAVAIRALLAFLTLAILTMAGAADLVSVSVAATIAAASIALSWARWRANVCLLSGWTMEVRRGLLFRSRRLIPLIGVQDITIEQSPLGWLLRCGTVEVRLRAGPPLRLDWIPDPQGFRARVLRPRVGGLVYD
jgi:membrane protein YdbS with pleckstrin-like domain